MAYSYEDILRGQYDSIAQQQALAAAELESARLSEDPHATMAAADRILALDKSREALDRRAHGFIAQQQAPRGNRFGLNEDELAVAHGHPDERLTNEAKEQMFANNKARYRQDVASGLRRSDQGRDQR